MDEINEMLKKMELDSMPEVSEKDILERYEDSIAVGQDYWSEQYDMTSKMIEFYNGDDVNNNQWPEEVQEQRNQPNKERPMPTISLFPMCLKMVYGRLIQDPPDVTITPAPGSFSAGSFKTRGDDEMSYKDLIEGLIRKTLYDCNAQYHFKKAAKQLLVGGFAWFRLRDDFVSDSSFNRTLSIEAIDELLEVFIDPSATDQNYADAEWAIVRQKMSGADFKKKYGGTDAGSSGSFIWGWGSGSPKYDEEVYVDEFFDRVEVPAVLIEYETKMSEGSQRSTERFFDNDDVKEFVTKVYESGGRVVRFRKLQSHIVNWYRIGGGKILDSSEWKGTRIPIVFVPGREFQDVGGKRIYKGMFSEARDSQRLLNYFVACMIEAMGSSIKPGIVISREQLAGNEDFLKTLGEYGRQFYVYTDVNIAGGSSTTAPHVMGESYVPSAEFTAMEQMRLFTMMQSGVTEADLGQQGNEVSGKAIQARQSQGTVSAFEFLDNLRGGVVSAVRGVLEVIPMFYSGNDVLRIMDIQQNPAEVNVPDDWVGGKRLLNTESAVIRVRAGRSYNDIYDSFAAQIEELIKQNNPAWMAILVEWLDVNGIPLAKNLERRLLPMMDPRSLTPAELKEMSEKPEPPLSPEQKLRQAEAEAKMKEADAKLEEMRMKTGEFSPAVKSKIEKIVAESLEKFLGDQGASPRSAQARQGGA